MSTTPRHDGHLARAAAVAAVAAAARLSLPSGIVDTGIAAPALAAALLALAVLCFRELRSPQPRGNWSWRDVRGGAEVVGLLLLLVTASTVALAACANPDDPRHRGKDWALKRLAAGRGGREGEGVASRSSFACPLQVPLQHSVVASVREAEAAAARWRSGWPAFLKPESGTSCGAGVTVAWSPRDAVVRAQTLLSALPRGTRLLLQEAAWGVTVRAAAMRPHCTHETAAEAIARVLPSPAMRRTADAEWRARRDRGGWLWAPVVVTPQPRPTHPDWLPAAEADALLPAPVAGGELDSGSVRVVELAPTAAAAWEGAVDAALPGCRCFTVDAVAATVEDAREGRWAVVELNGSMGLPRAASDGFAPLVGGAAAWWVDAAAAGQEQVQHRGLAWAARRWWDDLALFIRRTRSFSALHRVDLDAVGEAAARRLAP